MKRKFTLKFKWVVIITLMTLGLPKAFAQSDTINIGQSDDFYDVIVGDTLENGEPKNLNRVYSLERGGVYKLDATIYIEYDFTLIGEEGDASTMPAILIPSINEETQTVPNLYFWEVGHNVNITLKNIIFQGVPADEGASGIVVFNCLRTRGDTVRTVIDKCVFNGFSGTVISDKSPGAYIKITNSKFRNLIERTNAWAGSAFKYDATGYSDSLILINNTFFNATGSVRSTALNKAAIIEHNTFFGTLTGHLKQKSHINYTLQNNLFVGHFCQGLPFGDTIYYEKGALPAPTRTDTLSGEQAETLIQLGLTEDDRIFHLRNNAYYVPEILSEGWETMSAEGGPVIPTPWMNEISLVWFDPDKEGYPNYIEENNYDGVNPGFPTDVETKIFGDIVDWVSKQRQVEGWEGYWRFYEEEGKRFQLQWPLPEDLTYTNTELATGSTGGLHVGDLNWWPNDWNKYYGIPGVGINNHKTVAEIELVSCYPNPSTGITKISYNLDHPSAVRLTAFDITGQNSYLIVDEKQFTGSHMVEWDASSLPNGVYFVRFTNGSQTITKKVLIIK